VRRLGADEIDIYSRLGYQGSWHRDGHSPCPLPIKMRISQWCSSSPPILPIPEFIPMRGSDCGPQDESSAPFLGYGESKVISSPLKRRRKLVYTVGTLGAFFCMWTLSTFLRHPDGDIDLLGPVNLHSENKTVVTVSHPPGVKGPPTFKFRGTRNFPSIINLT
jgi:hypothetical protein